MRALVIGCDGASLLFRQRRSEEVFDGGQGSRVRREAGRRRTRGATVICTGIANREAGAVCISVLKDDAGSAYYHGS